MKLFQQLLVAPAALGLLLEPRLRTGHRAGGAGGRVAAALPPRDDGPRRRAGAAARRRVVCLWYL